MKIEKVSATVSSAIDEVLKEYNLTFSDIEYEVLQQPSKGFLGFGKKLAKVSFVIKKDKNLDTTLEIRQEQVKEVEKDKTYFSKKDTNNNSIRTLKDNFFEDDMQNGYENKKVNENAPEIARKFLEDVFKAMDLDIKIEIDFVSNKNLLINLDGENIGIVIGKRGRTLDSLQYLVNLIINKGEYSYINVKIDTFEYRKKRKEALETLANNIVKKVRTTNKVVKLEPMNSYERKIIHNSLKNYTDIKSFSEGKEPFRYVVIIPKK